MLLTIGNDCELRYRILFSRLFFGSKYLFVSKDVKLSLTIGLGRTFFNYLCFLSTSIVLIQQIDLEVTIRNVAFCRLFGLYETIMILEIHLSSKINFGERDTTSKKYCII